RATARRPGRRRWSPAARRRRARAPCREGTGAGGQPAASFDWMQVKVWPIILLAVPSIIRAPTDASVPEIATSADQSMVVGPSGGPESAIEAVASTAEPGAWPCAL